MLAVARKVLGRIKRARAGSGEPPRSVRAEIASDFLRGEGIEVGALHNPLPVAAWARVRYVDRLSVADLRKHYPELATQPLVPVDIVDDGERLSRVADESQDFVIANHFLEHCEDPIGTMKQFVRVLRPGGVLFIGLPDKRSTFDAPRPVTTLEHLWTDHHNGPAGSRRGHFEEYVQAVHGLKTAEEIREHADRYANTGYSIHYHVWTPPAMLELFLALGRCLPIEIELMRQNGHEVLFILRKSGGLR